MAKHARSKKEVTPVTGYGATCLGCGKENMMRYQAIPGAGDFCSDCAPRAHHQPKSTFPFTTRNISGESVVVNSLYHLRKLEAQHGVQSFVYNHNNPEKMEQYRP